MLMGQMKTGRFFRPAPGHHGARTYTYTTAASWQSLQVLEVFHVRFEELQNALLMRKALVSRTCLLGWALAHSFSTIEDKTTESVPLYSGPLRST